VHERREPDAEAESLRVAAMRLHTLLEVPGLTGVVLGVQRPDRGIGVKPISVLSGKLDQARAADQVQVADVDMDRGRHHRRRGGAAVEFDDAVWAR